MLPPPQSLHAVLTRWCSQRLPPPQSLHLLVFSVSQAKHETELSVVQHTFSLLVMLCFFCVLVPLWFEMVQTACFTALALAVTHAGVLFELASFHSIARGDLLASHVLLVRIACSVCACIAHLVVYATGRNENC